MLETCPSACGACLGACHDADSDMCSEWSASGECVTNERFMLERCPASCSWCPTFDGKARRCDACFALQEAIWAELQPPPSTTGQSTTASHPIAPSELRRRVGDICNSHSWLVRDMTLTYQAECEHLISTRFESMAGSWVDLVARQPWPLDRATALVQKTALCTSHHSRSIGLPETDAACDERHVRHLGLGSAVGTTTCAGCRLFVGDAVALLRRRGQLIVDAQSAEYRQVIGDLRSICNDIPMRHIFNATVAAAASRGGGGRDGAAMAAAATAELGRQRAHEQCVVFMVHHSQALYRLAHLWPRVGVTGLMCTHTLRLCNDETAVDPAVKLREEL